MLIGLEKLNLSNKGVNARLTISTEAMNNAELLNELSKINISSINHFDDFENDTDPNDASNPDWYDGRYRAWILRVWSASLKSIYVKFVNAYKRTDSSNYITCGAGVIDLFSHQRIGNCNVFIMEEALKIEALNEARRNASNSEDFAKQLELSLSKRFMRKSISNRVKRGFSVFRDDTVYFGEINKVNMIVNKLYQMLRNPKSLEKASLEYRSVFNLFYGLNSNHNTTLSPIAGSITIENEIVDLIEMIAKYIIKRVTTAKKQQLDD